MIPEIVPMWYLKSDLPDVQSHLIRLLHAHKTRNVECKSTGEGPICIDTYCKETKELLEHAALCENTMDCMVIDILIVFNTIRLTNSID